MYYKQRRLILKTQVDERKRNMKKICTLLLTFSMALSLAACGGNSGNAASGGSSSGGDAKVLRLSTHLSGDHSTMQMAAKFKEILVEKSGGSLDVEFYTDGQLGGQTENCVARKLKITENEKNTL